MISIRRAVIAEAKRRGLSGYALSKLANVTMRSVQRYLSGEKDIPTAKADKLLSALGFKLQRPGRQTTKG